MQRITTNSLFLVLLIAASLWAMALSAGLAGTPATHTSAPRNVSTVRAYYAAVRDYFETGDLAGIRAVVDPGVLEAASPGAETDDLMLHLRGLRQTYPALDFSIEALTTSNDTVIARIMIDYGPIADEPVSPLTTAITRQQTDTFRIAGNRIVDWHYTGASYGTFVSTVGTHEGLEIHAPRTLTFARITFAAGKTGFVAIHTPVLLILEQGSVQLQGNSHAIVSTVASQEGEVTGSGSEVTVFPGESILLPRGSMVLGASSPRPVTLIAVMLLPGHVPPPDHEIHTSYPSPEELLTYKSSGQIGHGVSIELLARAEGGTTGALQLVAGIARLEPGVGMELEQDLESIVIVPRSGSVSRLVDPTAQRHLLINEGTALASVWIAAVRPISTE